MILNVLSVSLQFGNGFRKHQVGMVHCQRKYLFKWDNMQKLVSVSWYEQKTSLVGCITRMIINAKYFFFFNYHNNNLVTNSKVSPATIFLISNFIWFISLQIRSQWMKKQPTQVSYCPLTGKEWKWPPSLKMFSIPGMDTVLVPTSMMA